jgi:hypothetical protein
MKTSIAQIIALTAYGNAFLQNQPVSFNKNHSTAQHCKEITFIEWPSEIVLAKDPNAWFQFLKKHQIESLILDYAPDNGIKESRELMGFIGGGGRWLISSIKGENAEIWEGRWIAPKENETRDNWTVNYGRIVKEWSLPKPETFSSIDQSHKKFKNTLESIISFAKDQNLEKFVEIFKEGLTCLSSELPNINLYHKDLLIEENYPLKARQVLAACQTAFVFGTMGSWNDMTYEGKTQERYDKLSNALFSSIIKSICTVVDSFP